MTLSTAQLLAILAILDARHAHPDLLAAVEAEWRAARQLEPITEPTTESEDAA